MSSHDGQAIKVNRFASRFQLLRDFVTLNRLPETIGYNIAYLGVGVGLAATSRGLTSLGSHWVVLMGSFLAAMLSKMQASVADVIHDRELDRANPEKDMIPNALDRLGLNCSLTILVTELIGGVLLWGWIALATNAPALLVFGAVTCLLGFIYTYPPRLKECGVFNHLTTTTVDVGYVAIFFVLAGGAITELEDVAMLSVVFLYAFGYHIAHQAADTYYDRRYGISTLTQRLGVHRSILLACISTALAALINIFCALFLAGGILLLIAFCYAYMAIQIRDVGQRVRSERVSQWFDIALWATVMNAAMVFDLVVL